MGSPVGSYKNFFNIDKNAATAVYLQIAHQFINAIQRGYILAGAQLPGTRTLSRDVGLHRKTLVAAFDELHKQGWINIIPNKGAYVSDIILPSQKVKRAPAKVLTQYALKAGFTFSKNNILETRQEDAQLALAFNDGQPDVRLAPTTLISRFYAAALRKKVNHKYLGYTRTRNLFFNEQLCNFLHQTRGLHTAPHNILITRGTEMNMYIAAAALLYPGDVVLVGHLSYYMANMVFQQAGARLKQIPVDDEGINTDMIERICKKQKVRMVYVTPQHHYPTTAALSASRRVALLQLSAQYGFIILEDDGDCGAFNQGQLLPPLLSGDANGMVVQIGCIGKTLPPGFRVGYIIAPENVMKELKKLQTIIDGGGDWLTERVLGELIAEGEIHRHYKRCQKIYQERRDHFCEKFYKHFSAMAQFERPAGGLAIWAKWKPELNLSKLSKACAGNGLLLPQILLYQNRQLTATRLGFGNFSEGEAATVLNILEKSVKEVLV